MRQKSLKIHFNLNKLNPQFSLSAYIFQHWSSLRRTKTIELGHPKFQKIFIEMPVREVCLPRFSLKLGSPAHSILCLVTFFAGKHFQCGRQRLDIFDIFEIFSRALSAVQVHFENCARKLFNRSIGENHLDSHGQPLAALLLHRVDVGLSTPQYFTKLCHKSCVSSENSQINSTVSYYVILKLFLVRKLNTIK